jgi:hypothetical protein
VATTGFGSPRLSWNQGLPCDVRLESAGTLRITFEGAADPALLAGLKFFPARQTDPGEPAVRVYGHKDIVARGEPTLTVADIVPGRYMLRPENTWQTAYVAEQSASFTMAPGGVGEVVVKVTRAAEVRGRVIDAKTRAGVRADMVGISAPAERGGGRVVFGWAKADADGRFRAFVKPGNLSVLIYSGQTPPGYVQPPTAIPTAPRR